MQAWTWWLLAALALGGIEIVTVDLFFIMAAAGALAAAAAAFAGATVPVQFAVFAVVSLVLIAVVRPLALRHLRQPPTSTNVDALLGAEAFVLEQVDARDGRVKLRGEVWSARASDATAVHAAGTKVHVVEVRGATVLVEGTT
jgi:membrane protein implicated in regulation of membrane protease activity